MVNESKCLFLCADVFPPLYPFLGKVFNEQLRTYGLRFVWVMYATEDIVVKETNWDGAPVILIPKPQPQNTTELLKTYWQYLKDLKRAVYIALKHYGPFFMVQVRNDPAMAYIAWQLKKKFKMRFVYQLSHLKEEQLMMYAQMRIYGSPIKNLLQGRIGVSMRNFFLRRADLVFPISEKMKETLASYGVPVERMVPLPEGVDSSIDLKVVDKEAKAIREKLGLEGKKVLIYVGTMNRFRQLDFLLKAFKLVLQAHPNVHLLMVGAGKEPQDLEWLKRQASELDIEQNITFTGWITRKMVPAYIQASDIGTSPIPPNKIFLNSSPIKILEYLALETPVVATDIPEQKTIIEQSGGGVCVPWDVERYADAINNLLNLPRTERRAMGKRGRDWVQKKRDFSVLARKILEAYNVLLSN